MKITQRKPTHRNDVAARMHHYTLPWVETSGHENSPYEHNNCLHAAISSAMAALQMDNIKDVRFWLGVAARQINEGVVAANKPYARTVPEPKK